MSTLKLSFNNEVRRISMQSGDLSYDQLLESARTLFPQLLEHPHVQVSWKDDEDDQVFVSSDMELTEALRIMRTGSKGYLRFDIHATQPRTGAASNYPSTVRKDEPKTEPAGIFSGGHVGVTCNECGVSPIHGIRYKCTVRNDFDICSDCEARTLQPYPMIKFYVPHKDIAASDIVVSINPPRHGHGHGCRGGGNRGKEKRGDDDGKGKRHRGVVCDQCGDRGFRGFRFKCTGRDDFDLCAECEGKIAVQPFPMVKVYSPLQCPNGLTVYTSSGAGAGTADATIECDLQLPHGLEFLREMFPPGSHIRGPWGSATWRERARQEAAPPPPAAPPSGPARHRHVRCNECGMKPIVGDRYTCTMRPDFDLCGACESKQQQPYPMMKIYFPEQQTGPHGPPYGMSPPPHHSPHHHRGLFGGRGWGCGRGGPVPWHGRCGRGGMGRGGMGRCGPDVAEAAAERARLHKEVLEVERETHRTKELDELEDDLLAMTMAQSLGSSDDSVTVTSGSATQAETEVSATAAEECKGGDEDDASASHLPLAAAALAEEEEQPPLVSAVAIKSKSRPMARFVRDVTMPDGSKVQPCSVFVKCWRVRNDGASAWPESCFLVNAGGDEMFANGVHELRIPVPSASAGEELDISAHLTAPAAIGRHVGYFRLQDDEQNWFGQRLWADIRVTDDDVAWQVISSSAMSVHEEDDDTETHKIPQQEGQGEENVYGSTSVDEASEVLPPTDEDIWARELELLAVMGFTDSEVVIPLLKELMPAPASPGEHPHPEGLQNVVLTLLSNQ